MKKKKVLFIGIGLVAICTIFIVGLILKDDSTKTGVLPVKEAVISRSHFLEENKYSNLIFEDFELAIGDVEKLYDIEILRNKESDDRALQKSMEIMNAVIDNFFEETVDKSNIVVDLYSDESISVNYNDVPSLYDDSRYANASWVILFENSTQEGGYMMQVDSDLRHVWLSKYGLNDICPSLLEAQKVYHYLSGTRQGEDAEINLQDGKIKLSELEAKALEFLNQNFVLEVSENITFSIANARLIANGDYEGISFLVRRNYKGIPFEYGPSSAVGEFIDKMGHDSGEIAYSVSTNVDTMLGFGQLNGTVVETNTISEMISIDEAVRILSEKIGENSVYDVYGIELVYRECEVPEERAYDVDAILKPTWKFLTMNQNDNKYTIFYVDVVTGEITERFEYYYE